MALDELPFLADKQVYERIRYLYGVREDDYPLHMKVKSDKVTFNACSGEAELCGVQYWWCRSLDHGINS